MDSSVRAASVEHPLIAAMGAAAEERISIVIAKPFENSGNYTVM
jgi:hypothetical protein